MTELAVFHTYRLTRLIRSKVPQCLAGKASQPIGRSSKEKIEMAETQPMPGLKYELRVQGNDLGLTDASLPVVRRSDYSTSVPISDLGPPPEIKDLSAIPVRLPTHLPSIPLRFA